jgi:hypothetical protein
VNKLFEEVFVQYLVINYCQLGGCQEIINRRGEYPMRGRIPQQPVCVTLNGGELMDIEQ